MAGLGLGLAGTGSEFELRTDCGMPATARNIHAGARGPPMESLICHSPRVKSRPKILNPPRVEFYNRRGRRGDLRRFAPLARRAAPPHPVQEACAKFKKRDRGPVQLRKVPCALLRDRRRFDPRWPPYSHAARVVLAIHRRLVLGVRIHGILQSSGRGSRFPNRKCLRTRAGRGNRKRMRTE